MKEFYFNSSRAKEAYQSEVKTLSKSIEESEDQIKQLNEELCKAELSYNEKKAKYEEIQEEIIAEKISNKVLLFYLILMWKEKKNKTLLLHRITRQATKQYTNNNLGFLYFYHVF